MFKGNTILLKSLQHLSSEPDFGVHHILFYIDGAKASLSRNTCDDILGFLTGTSHNPGTIVLRGIGISDIDGNPLLTHGENGILVKHCGSHVGKFTELLISNYINPLRIINNSGVRN